MTNSKYVHASIDEEAAPDHVVIEDDEPSDPRMHWGSWDTEYRARCRLCGWVSSWGKRRRAEGDKTEHIAECRVDPAWLNIIPPDKI